MCVCVCGMVKNTIKKAKKQLGYLNKMDFNHCGIWLYLSKGKTLIWIVPKNVKIKPFVNSHWQCSHTQSTILEEWISYFAIMPWKKKEKKKKRKKEANEAKPWLSCTTLHTMLRWHMQYHTFSGRMHRHRMHRHLFFFFLRERDLNQRSFIFSVFFHNGSNIS